MSKLVLNEDTENIIKSFIPDIERWILLRETYTNEYLRKGLEKKTVEQLTIILENLNEIVTTGELKNLWNFFNTLNVDIDKLKTQTKNCLTTLNEWCYIGERKEEIIEKILIFVQRLHNIICLKRIDVIEQDKNVSIFENLKLVIVKKTLKTSRQYFYASKALKVLLLLVSILRDPVKKIAIP
jgi:hypothetical protein